VAKRSWPASSSRRSSAMPSRGDRCTIRPHTLQRHSPDAECSSFDPATSAPAAGLHAASNAVLPPLPPPNAELSSSPGERNMTRSEDLDAECAKSRRGTAPFPWSEACNPSTRGCARDMVGSIEMGNANFFSSSQLPLANDQLVPFLFWRRTAANSGQRDLL